MNRFRFAILMIARLLMSLIFILSGIEKIIHWQDVEGSLVSTLCQWHVYLQGISLGEECIEFLYPIAPILLLAAVFLELVGGVFTIFRSTARLGALFLLLFLIPVTLVYHPFWFEFGDQFQKQLIAFLKNLSIVGGLLFIAVIPNPKGSLNSKF